MLFSFYDNRYRLAQNLHDDGYTGTTLYDMTYSRTSRIGSKQSIHPSLGYPDLVYGYDNSVHTHQPRVIHDNNSNEHMQLYWDANGNLRQLQSKSGNTRFHLWDDDNMLLLSVGPQSCGYYGNASDGKRAYKLAGTYDVSYINGQYVEGTALFDNAVLYPNPYMTVSNKCYTKHYFMGSERFCTTIGGGNNGNWLINPIDDLTTDEKRLLADLKDNYTYQYYYNDCFDYPHHFHHTANTDYTGTIVPVDGHYPDYQYNGYEMYYGKTNLLFYASLYDAIHDFYHHDKDDEPFYYHSDHLGSAAWITDKNGLPVQYLMYAPYGEQLLNQQSTTTYNERFTFTGKERDIETGYDYFGARNYLSALSIWGAVDPFADKYIYNSPYVYCDGNPIKFIDPDGMVVIDIQGHLVREVPETAFDEDDKHYQGFDWIRFVDDNGNVIMDQGTPMEMCFGKEGTIHLIENEEKYVIFTAEGDEAGTSLLKFLAQTGANVEWTQLKTGAENIGINYLSTSWNPKMNTSTKIVLSTYLPPATSVLREYIHSHPLDDPNPSGMHDRTNPKTGKYEKAGTWGDVGVKNFYQAQNQYGSGVVFKIYLPALDDYVIF